MDPPAIDAGLQSELEDWLARHGKPPEEYIESLFAAHDVVLLGEQHRIRHDVLLVQRMLPRLDATGVHVFATEFARREDQAMLDSLMTGSEWNEDLAREIIFRQFVPWGFREYVDILRVAWEVNRGRSSASLRLRVLGVNNSLDYSQIQKEGDAQDPEIWQRVLHGQTEADWAGPVLEAVARGEKVLAHCGIHHAFTGYRQPRVENGEFQGFGRERFGNRLRAELGERVVTVFLHAPWNGPDGYDATFVHPADGRLDAFMLAREDGPFAVGFDVKPSPLGGLPITGTVYRYGYDPLTLADFCDGWIYTKPIHEYEPVTYIEGWIHPDNLEAARANAMNPYWRTLGVRELNDGCRSYQKDFVRFFGGLR